MAIVCLESGGTKLVAALADRRGRIRKRLLEYRQAGQTAPETVAALIRMGQSLAAGTVPDAVSWGYGGLVDRRQRRPLDCFHEAGWGEIDPLPGMEAVFGAPLVLENDCKLAALAEAHLGAGRQSDRVLYLTVGTGIGGGYVQDGRILALGPWGELEVGHLQVETEGPECPCGNRGCLETLCSGPGLETLAQRLAGHRMPAPDLFRNFKSGDSNSRHIVDIAAQYMARALAATINLTAPSCVVLGGGVMTGNPEYLRKIEERTLPLVFPRFRNGLRFALSALGNDVVCQGAALLAIQHLETGGVRGRNCDLQGTPTIG